MDLFKMLYFSSLVSYLRVRPEQLVLLCVSMATFVTGVVIIVFMGTMSTDERRRFCYVSNAIFLFNVSLLWSLSLSEVDKFPWVLVQTGFAVTRALISAAKERVIYARSRPLIRRHWRRNGVLLTALVTALLAGSMKLLATFGPAMPSGALKQGKIRVTLVGVEIMQVLFMLLRDELDQDLGLTWRWRRAITVLGESVLDFVFSAISLQAHAHLLKLHGARFTTFLIVVVVQIRICIIQMKEKLRSIIKIFLGTERGVDMRRVGDSQHLAKKEEIQDDCAICRYPMEANLVRLNCGHLFHTACLRTWFNLENTTCPMCRFDFKQKKSFLYYHDWMVHWVFTTAQRIQSGYPSTIRPILKIVHWVSVVFDLMAAIWGLVVSITSYEALAVWHTQTLPERLSASSGLSMPSQQMISMVQGVRSLEGASQPESAQQEESQACPDENAADSPAGTLPAEMDIPANAREKIVSDISSLCDIFPDINRSVIQSHVQRTRSLESTVNILLADRWRRTKRESSFSPARSLRTRIRKLKSEKGQQGPESSGTSSKQEDGFDVPGRRYVAKRRSLDESRLSIGGLGPPRQRSFNFKPPVPVESFGAARKIWFGGSQELGPAEETHAADADVGGFSSSDAVPELRQRLPPHEYEGES